MGSDRIIPVSEEIYQGLLRVAAKTRQTPEEVAADILGAGIREFEEDPLLKLAGCIESGPSDLGTSHDDYLGRALAEESRRGGDG